MKTDFYRRTPYLTFSSTGFALGMVTGILFACLIGCGQKADDEQEQQLPKETYEDLRQQAIDLVVKAQSTLLRELSIAIGEPNAIAVCKIRSNEIVDSLSDEKIVVSRITNRLRNPDNALKTLEDRKAWIYYKRDKSKVHSIDTVLYSKAGSATYYKPIYIASDLCLKCHGSRSQDISLETLSAIDKSYPTDAAVNYHVGDLRGLWKVDFSE